MKKIVIITGIVVIAGLFIWRQLDREVFQDDGNTPKRILAADNEFPAAGVCMDSPEEVRAVVTVNEDVPSPRCQKVVAGKRLIIKNNTDQVLSMWFGKNKEYLFSVPARGEFEIPVTLGEMLAPGVHVFSGDPFSGPEIWMIAE